MLPIVGRVVEGLRYLNELRSSLVAEYGRQLNHV
jgi:hypothetical protein